MIQDEAFFANLSLAKKRGWENPILQLWSVECPFISIELLSDTLLQTNLMKKKSGNWKLIRLFDKEKPIDRRIGL